MENDNSLEEEFQETTVLHEHFSFTADKGQEPLRVDKYLMNRIENATRTKIQNAAKEGNIFVDDVAVKSNYKVKGGNVDQSVYSSKVDKHTIRSDVFNCTLEYLSFF